MAQPKKTACETRRKRCHNQKTSAKESKLSGILGYLPDLVLQEILLQAASSPENLYGWLDIKWLASVRLVCHSFDRAALPPLYNNPPSFPSKKMHRLLIALKKYPERRPLVKKAVIEVHPLLHKKEPGHGYFDLNAFIHLTRHLRSLDFVCSEQELIPFRPQKNVSMKYDTEMFLTLDGTVDAEKYACYDTNDDGAAIKKPPLTRLRQWHWNEKFARGFVPADYVKIHSLKCFEWIERLKLSQFAEELPANSHTRTEDTKYHQLAIACGKLEKLHELEFFCSPLANEDCFVQLIQVAGNLKLSSLKFTNCPKLTSSALERLLESPLCRDLKHLEVLYCQSCALSFLESLDSTPILETLHFNALYFGSLSMLHNSAPNYVSLFRRKRHIIDVEDPSKTSRGYSVKCIWPETLRSVKLLNLRQWDHEECELFLNSLVEARPHFKWLQVLWLHCMLPGLGWRERATFRDVWRTKILQEFTQPDEYGAEGTSSLESAPTANKSPNVNSRKRTRGAAPDATESQKLLRRSSRKLEAGDSPVKPHGKGGCRLGEISVTFDNQRPSEYQRNEGDFVDGGGEDDSEDEGDRSSKKRRASGGKQGVRKTGSGGKSTRTSRTRTTRVGR